MGEGSGPMHKGMFWGLMSLATVLVVAGIMTVLPDRSDRRSADAGRAHVESPKPEAGTAAGATASGGPEPSVAEVPNPVETAAVAGEPPGGGEPDAGETAQAPAEATVAAVPAAEAPDRNALAALDTDSAGGEEPASGERAPEEAAVTPPEGAPDFDLVRVSPDGQIVVAGRAKPGETVEVVIEGEVVGSAEADRQGAFVAILDTSVSDVPRELVLRVAAEHDGDQAAEPNFATIEVAENAANGEREEPAEAESRDEPEIAWMSSAPVIILPRESSDEAPVVVSPGPEAVEVVQPAVAEDRSALVLDRLTYRKGGDLIAAGHGQETEIVRTYVDGELVSEVPVGAEGNWETRIPRGVAEDAALLRFDVVTPEGTVSRRVETPFSYDDDGGVRTLREREIVIQKGNNLWRIAEQYYGDGIRYSVIFGANRQLIRNPDLIYPGQVFSVPELVDNQ